MKIEQKQQEIIFFINKNIITNSNKIIKKNDDKNELNTRNGFDIDKIKEVSFGDRLLSKLFDIYPQ